MVNTILDLDNFRKKSNWNSRASARQRSLRNAYRVGVFYTRQFYSTCTKRAVLLLLLLLFLLLNATYLIILTNLDKQNDNLNCLLIVKYFIRLLCNIHFIINLCMFSTYIFLYLMCVPRAQMCHVHKYNQTVPKSRGIRN
jgi:hypothetical protein